MNNMIDFTAEKLKRNPIEYSVVITHLHNQIIFKVIDIKDDPRSRLAVADDLEKFAASIRERHRANC
uniref:Uncharacterized protein n=1 Tax=Candidatus Kentrum sp. TUN TaxID=2126343 RepID=A0A451AMS0_9GAMM|nr:MAG: hypothetical protein BECKTUN1418F_GA0071002_11446 [Candidatus Kentron sp. TUN]VFK60310.1 MAG: hypothetical protein BECKTUN1418D_GA0071000_11206 [Candidatus Kentron sp. TUN]VFK67333.1 MAG: hypothetical protein BECKTUN1418E_GA0071001_11426 [Candidatus Kentron sp. TUN]